MVSTLSSIVWESESCCIISYPKELQAELVSSPYGVHKDQQTAVGEELTSRKKCKKRCQTLNEGEELQQKYYSEIQHVLSSCYKILFETGYEIQYFPVLQEGQEQSVSMCSVDLAGLCNLDRMIASTEDMQVIDLNKGVPVVHDINVFGNIIYNSSSHDIQMVCWGQTFVVPRLSSFVLSDISKVHLLIQNSSRHHYNLIVIDPPWENRSAIRGKKYQWLEWKQMLQLPIRELSAVGGLVAVWVTNKRKLVNWVKKTLFPQWGVTSVAEWIWLKVTTKGEYVFPIDSLHKKPYEILLIGRTQQNNRQVTGNIVIFDDKQLISNPQSSNDYNSFMKKHIESSKELRLGECEFSEEDEPKTKRQKVSGIELFTNLEDEIVSKSETNSDVPEKSQKSSRHESVDEKLENLKDKPTSIPCSLESISSLPPNYVFMCIPSAVHSQKPYLGDILRKYVGEDINGLELFARNLLPCWTSWGNEVLKFQAVH